MDFRWWRTLHCILALVLDGYVFEVRMDMRVRMLGNSVVVNRDKIDRSTVSWFAGSQRKF